MADCAIVMATSDRYIGQAAAMFTQLAQFGVADRAWFVPLGPLAADAEARLRELVGPRLTPPLELPFGLAASGNKPFLPTMVPPHRQYLLLDTDVLILRPAFFERFVGERLTLVADDFSVAQYLRSTPHHRARFAAFPETTAKPYLQTGVIGLPRDWYQQLRSELFGELESLAKIVRTGDLQVWNALAWRHPAAFELVRPASCLVLRPDGSGTSTKHHSQHTTWQHGSPHYRGEPVLALHYTSSRGRVQTLEDFRRP